MGKFNETGDADDYPPDTESYWGRDEAEAKLYALKYYGYEGAIVQSWENS